MTTAPILSAFSRVAVDPRVPLPPVLFRRLWDQACATGNEDDQVVLLGRRDAPVDLLAQFAQLTSAKLRVAYLSRSDITVGEAVATLATESRVTVLGALAGAAATPEAVFPALVEKMRTSGSSRLAAALLKSARTPSAQLVEVVEHIAAGLDPAVSFRLSNELRMAVGRLEVKDANQAAQTLPPWACESLMGMRGLSTKARLSLVNRVIAALAVTDQRGWATPQAGSMVTALMGCEDLQLEVMVALDAVLGAGLKHLPKHQVPGWRSQLAHRSDGLLDPSLSPEQISARRAQIEAATGTDPAVLTTLAAEASATKDRPLAARLCANPATPAAAAADLAGLLNTDDTVLAAYKAQKGHQGRDPLRLAVLCAHPSLLLTKPSGAKSMDADLSDFDDPPGAARALMAHFGNVLRETNSAHYATSPPVNVLLYVIGHPAAQPANPLMAMPWPLAMQLISAHSMYVSHPHERVAAVLATLHERFGEDLGMWASFERLAPEFAGTLDDLVATVHAVADAAA